MSSAPLVSSITTLLADPLDQILGTSILGTIEVDRIADRVSAFVAAELGRSIVGCPLFTQSVGAVFGLDLDDGARIVVKVHRYAAPPGGFASQRELNAVYAAADAFAVAGFPCARVLVSPRPYETGSAAAIMTWLDPGAGDDPAAPTTRPALVAMLAHAVQLGEHLPRAVTGDLPRAVLPVDRVLPTPHNAMFDFTTPGGAWIDERARAARAILDEPAALIIMHTDPSCANVRVVNGTVAAVYDMDSIAWIDEHRCVASAAVHYTYTGDQGWRWPTRDEALAFIAGYEAARGISLDRRRLDAAMTYAMAYTARCELGITGELGAMGQMLAR